MTTARTARWTTAGLASLLIFGVAGPAVAADEGDKPSAAEVRGQQRAQQRERLRQGQRRMRLYSRHRTIADGAIGGQLQTTSPGGTTNLIIDRPAGYWGYWGHGGIDVDIDAPYLVDPVRYIRMPGSGLVYAVFVGDDGRLTSRFVSYGPDWWGWYDDAAGVPHSFEQRGIYAETQNVLNEWDRAHQNAVPAAVPPAPRTPQAPQNRVPVIDFDALAPLDQAEVFLAAGRIDQALAKYKEHVDANPEDTRAIRQYAIALMRDGRWEEGVALLGMAYRENPSLASEPLSYILFESDPDVFRQVSREAVRRAHRYDSAAGWLTVAALMQADGREARVVIPQIERAEGHGLEQPVVNEFRRVFGLPVEAAPADPAPAEAEQGAGQSEAPAEADPESVPQV